MKDDKVDGSSGAIQADARTREEGTLAIAERPRSARGLEIRSSAEEITWLELVGRCIEANARRRGLNIDRREIRAIIEKNDESNRQGGI